VKMVMWALLFLAVGVCWGQTVFLVERGVQTGLATMTSFNISTGKTIGTSPTHFRYPVPLVQTTTGLGAIYVITFPTDATGPVLYLLNSKTLALVREVVNTPFSFFDLQFCNLQKVLYGIFVSSRYGRELSMITVSDSGVVAKPFFSLPFMWYVNASSFDQKSLTYFALINNFPGQPNSTSDQRLIVAEVRQEPQKVTVHPLPHPETNYIFKFISWTPSAQKLFGLAISGTTALIATIDTASGTSSVFLKYENVLDIGPSFVSAIENREQFCAILVIRAGNQLTCWDVVTKQQRIVSVSSSDIIVGAACDIVE